MVAGIGGLEFWTEQVYGYFEQVNKRLEGIPWALQAYQLAVTTVYMSPAGHPGK